MMIFLDLLVVMGAIVLVLGTVASASKNRAQRKTGAWSTQGIWRRPQQQAGFIQMSQSPDDEPTAARNITAAGMQ